jgi:excisionase family DNA binding protein
MSRRLTQLASPGKFSRGESSLEELLTVGEVAAELNVTKDKAAMLTHWGVGLHRVGRKVLVSRRLLNQFVAAIDC